MRESLFEQLKKKEIICIDEFSKIINLLDRPYSNTLSYFNNAFKKSVFCVYFEDFETALYKLFEIDGVNHMVITWKI